MNLGLNKSNAEGFSLVELLVVLSTFALVLFGVAIPSYQKSLAQNLTQTANDLQAAVSHYQDTASLLEQDVTMAFSLTKNLIEVTEPPLLPTGHSRTTSLPVPGGLHLSAAAFGNFSASNVLILRHDLTATPGRFTLSDFFNHSCSIIVTLRGATRVDCI